MRPTPWTRSALPLFAAVALACGDATAPAPLVGGVPDDTPPGSTEAPSPRATALGSAEAPLRLTGGGYLTEWTFTSSVEHLHGFVLTVLASNGALVEDEGRCCRILGDTLLQINTDGTVGLGARQMQPPELELGGADFRHYGADDALVIIRDGDNRMIYYVPVSTWTMDVTHYVAPSEGTQGEVRGRATFEATVLVQERANVLAPYFLSQLPGTAKVHADFVTPLRFQTRSYSVPF